MICSEKRLRVRIPIARMILVATLFVSLPRSFLLYAASGSGAEAASFLDIPVGAGPAALGSAYSALASDAYAPVYNPAGLGFLDSTQIAGQHVTYINPARYEFASAVHPLGHGNGLGVSVQYLTSGNLPGTDIDNNPIGDFSGYYAAYNLSYGQKFMDRFSWGLTGKMISAKIADVSASAFAADLGSMYKPTDRLTLAATLTNLGNKLKFISEGDSLPLAFHFGGTYVLFHPLRLNAEIIYPKTGLASGHVGIEYSPIEMIDLRTGYRTDTTRNLSALAGYTLGIGLHVWGQELAYAWLPMGDLGDTHHLSIVLRWGQSDNKFIFHTASSKPYSATAQVGGDSDPEFKPMMQLLEHDDASFASQKRMGSLQ
jgi:Uncharacterised protein family (UPF0164)